MVSHSPISPTFGGKYLEVTQLLNEILDLTLFTSVLLRSYGCSLHFQVMNVHRLIEKWNRNVCWWRHEILRLISLIVGYRNSTAISNCLWNFYFHCVIVKHYFQIPIFSSRICFFVCWFSFFFSHFNLQAYCIILSSMKLFSLFRKVCLWQVSFFDVLMDS